VKNTIKNTFFTGLVILLPVALTVAILMFLFNFLTDPFRGAVQAVLSYYDVLDGSDTMQSIVSKILVLLFLFGLTMLLGWVGRWFFFNSLVDAGNYVLNRIPFIRSIYKTSQDVINTLFGSSQQSFKKVVLVPFPDKSTRSIGFVTREDIGDPLPGQQKKWVSVFVPTAPNPTSGFLMLFPANDVEPLDMKVEEAFKYVISCGVIMKPLTTEESL